ncbi:MAG TPA: FN3 domain-containing metallophosphoesterase family protein, partial [Candidatus Hydrogenedentes bacterium]|nr:FN3 domain-containing metallophosphoesterase family protein [Candidatus Hydrogenedentota bacterium]
AFVVVDPRPPKIVAGPWLQLANPGEMTVCWITNVPATGWVEYGEEFSQRAHASHFGLIDAMTHIHRVTLKGLTPGASVDYRVAAKRVFGIYPICGRFGASMHDAKHTFRVPNPAADKVSFVVISDLHDRPDHLPQLTRVTNIKQHDFVVFNGDTFTYVNNEYQIISHLLRPASELFAAEIPFVLVRGNHEARGAFARHLPEYVSLPGGNPYVSSFRIGSASFLVLDTGEDKPDDHIEYFGLADFKTWKAEEFQMLPSLVGSDSWKSSPFQILLAHIPGFDNSEWYPQLNSAGIDLHIAGHMHCLETRMPPSHANKLGAEDRLFPIQIIGGNARGTPDENVVGIITVTPASITMDAIDGYGKKMEQKTFQRVEASDTSVK